MLQVLSRPLSALKRWIKLLQHQRILANARSEAPVGAASSIRIKYAVHPGCVISLNDGEHHEISYGQLIRLYQVPVNCCVRWDTLDHTSFVGRDPHHYVHLYPRYHGDYDIDLRIRKMVEGPYDAEAEFYVREFLQNGRLREFVPSSDTRVTE